ncbi:MAG: RIP metalloprotease RseP [Gammaproteobacteria bacterium]|nr:RIP metalloprotease RseP [Gammaproteobacteria bacterium]MDE0367297.1 RIP metalloprotease RseP [Gammaproteobacteria bacterium]
MLIYPLAFLVTLGVLVTIHELGHFVVARWSGVRIVRFSVGFGKPIWSRFDRHGTEFALAAIPLGGYVRMLDERDADAGVEIRRGDVTYTKLSVWWRMAIAVAGPFANFVLAAVAYWCLAVAGTVNLVPMIGELEETSPAWEAGMENYREIVAVDGRPVKTWQEVVMALSNRLGDSGEIQLGVREFGDDAATTVAVPVRDWLRGVADPDLLDSLGLAPAHLAVVGLVQADGPASRGGVEVWDRITAIDGVPVEDWPAMVGEVQGSPGRATEWTVVRRGVTLILSVTPDSRVLEDGSEIGFVGIGWATNQVRYGPLEAVPRSLAETGSKTLLMLDHLKKMFVGAVSVRNLGGPITIAKVAGDSAQAGWRVYVGILALLSISLGVLNMLPIPMLDGGHVLYCLAELIGRRPVPERVQLVGAQVGLLVVGGIIMLVLINDIARFM